jgi:hypothetical protein
LRSRCPHAHPTKHSDVATALFFGSCHWSENLCYMFVFFNCNWVGITREHDQTRSLSLILIATICSEIRRMCWVYLSSSRTCGPETTSFVGSFQLDGHIIAFSGYSAEEQQPCRRISVWLLCCCPFVLVTEQ